MKIKDKKYYRIAGVLWCITALISCIFGFIDHDLGTQIPIGMIWFCIGMMFLVFSLTGTKRTKKAKSKV